MNNEIVMDRYETLSYLIDQLNNDVRLVLPRYNDGEYMLMNKLPGHVAQDSVDVISDLLIRSIKVKGQLVCINHLKPHNIERQDVWFRTQQYLMQQSGQDIYGCGNWMLHDFCTDNVLLPKLFSGKVLLVAGLVEESCDILKNVQPNMEFYKTPIKNAVEKYEDIKADLYKVVRNYDTTLFACGPIGKVLIPDFIHTCNCNLIDIGSVLNALVDLTDRWPMSWAKSVDLNEKRSVFYEKLGDLNEFFNA